LYQQYKKEYEDATIFRNKYNTCLLDELNKMYKLFKEFLDENLIEFIKFICQNNESVKYYIIFHYF
jgi:hypothetical protein